MQAERRRVVPSPLILYEDANGNAFTPFSMHFVIRASLVGDSNQGLYLHHTPAHEGGQHRVLPNVGTCSGAKTMFQK